MKSHTPKPTLTPAQAPVQAAEAPKPVQTAASTAMDIGGPVVLEAAAPSEDLLAEFAPGLRGAANPAATGAAAVKNYGPDVDEVLDSKIHAMLQGERVILSDKDCGAIARLDAEWTGGFATSPNPNRVGILDAWVGTIKTKERIRAEALAYDDLTALMMDADEAMRSGDKATAASKLLSGADLAEKWNLDYRRRYDAAWMRKTAAELGV